VASSAVIPFNTATGRHLAPFVNKMQPAPTGVDKTGWRAELAKLDYLAAASFKFMNYARKSLVRGEKVIQTVWQPPIRQHLFTPDDRVTLSLTRAGGGQRLDKVFEASSQPALEHFQDELKHRTG
jgi:hypothetical protein